MIKVLTINWCYAVGSTGKIILDIEKELKDENVVFFHCYENGEKVASENVYRLANRYEGLFYYLFARFTGLKYGTGYHTTLKLLKKIKKERPDIVHIHCPNTYCINLYSLLTYLKENNIKTVISNHAEFFYTGNCPHAYECNKYLRGCGDCEYVFDKKRPFLFERTNYEWRKMRKAFDKFNTCLMIAVSEWQYDRMERAPICQKQKKKVIHNGIDTEIFKPSSEERKKICKQRFQVENNKVAVFVTSRFVLDENDLKGGKFIFKLAKQMEELIIIVVGNYVLPKDCVKPNNLIFLGNISNQYSLAEYYSMADISIICSKRETYGMTCAESLACGTPIVGFKAGGPESIALKKYSEFVEYGDVNALRRAINKMIEVKKTDENFIRREAEKKYSMNNMAYKYLECYKELVSEK